MVHSNHQQWLLQQTLTNLTGDAVASLWGRWVTFGNEATRPAILVVAGHSLHEGSFSRDNHTGNKDPQTALRDVRQGSARPGRHGDGRGSHGLSLLFEPMKLGGHSRTRNRRLRINGKPVSIGLGSFPDITLAEARRAALENRRAVARGHDPRNSILTLAEASERVLAIHSANWKHGVRSAEIGRSSRVPPLSPNRPSSDRPVGMGSQDRVSLQQPKGQPASQGGSMSSSQCTEHR